jgi:hypothetical protein
MQHARWHVTALLIAGIALIGCASVSSSLPREVESPMRPTPTGVPAVTMAAFAPAPDSVPSEVQHLLQAVDFHTDDAETFYKLVEDSSPHALIVHRAVLVKLDTGWLAQQAKKGRIIAGINTTPSDLDRALNREARTPNTESSPPPVVQEPYLFYRYQQYAVGRGMSGSGFVDLTQDPNQFRAYVGRVLLSAEANGLNLLEP